MDDKTAKFGSKSYTNHLPEVFAGKGANGGTRAQCNHQWESWRVAGQPCACFVIFGTSFSSLLTFTYFLRAFFGSKDRTKM
jgi:hypothetical protein